MSTQSPGPYRLLIFLLMVTAPSLGALDPPSWLSQHYLTKDDGPNYDWPNSFYPQQTPEGTITTLDGKIHRLPPGAQEVQLGPSEWTPEKPLEQRTPLTLRYKFESPAQAQELWKTLGVWMETQGTSLGLFKAKNYDSVFTLTAEGPSPRSPLTGAGSLESPNGPKMGK